MTEEQIKANVGRAFDAGISAALGEYVNGEHPPGFEEWWQDNRDHFVPPDRPCPRCRGCGQVANSDDAEPWTDWTDLPKQSQLAIDLGLVAPVPCPECRGTGQRL